MAANAVIEKSTVFAAVMLSLLCLLIPTYQWAIVSTDAVMAVLGGAAAFAIGICKFTFFPLAATLWSGGRYVIASLLVVFGAAALYVSISTTSNLLSSSSIYRATEKANSSIQVEQIQIEINDLNKSIESLNESIAIDIDLGYRKRAAESQVVLDGYISKRRQSVEKLGEISKGDLKAPDSIYLHDTKFSMGGVSVELEGHLSASLILHIVCVLSVLSVSALSGMNARLPEVRAEIRPAEIEEENTSQPKTRRSKSKSSGDSKLSSEQGDIARKIVAGEFGNSPTIKGIISEKVIKGGYAKVKPIFDSLVVNGKLVAEGNKFELVQKTI